MYKPNHIPMVKKMGLKALPALTLAVAIHNVHGAERASIIEEVVVTAQKKAESLQDTPIAISAFSADALAQMGAQTAADIGEYTPNVNIVPTMGSKFNIRMDIRGLGTAEPSLAIDPKVGVYLDGIYIARSAGAVFDIVDLERIEVLRGPQGTLWGKNTTGGAINMVTQKPQGTFGFKQKLSLGNDGYVRSTTTVDTPSVGGLSAKMTYMKKEYDGWANNTSSAVITEKDLGSEDTQAYRLAVRWDVSDSVGVDYSYDRTNGEAVAIPVQVASVLSPTSALIPTIDTSTGKSYGGNPFAQMSALANSKDRQETFNVDGQGSEHVDIAGHNLTVTWQVGDIEFKSLSSYREYDSLAMGIDSDGGSYVGVELNPQTFSPIDPSVVTPTPIFHALGSKSQQQSSQEFQAVGMALDNRLNYVVGLYYFEEDGKEINPWTVISYNSGFGINALLKGRLGQWYSVDNKSEAAYGQFAYDFTDKLTVTLGLRYTQDEKSLTLLADDPDVNQAVSVSDEWNEFTSSLTANYQFNDDVSVYAKVAEGFASGVYNPGTVDRNPANAITVEPALRAVDPEETTAYEVGIKSMWLDQRLQFNGALFYNDNKNLQVTDFIDKVRTSLNSGESDANGIELELIALPMPGLMLNASYGYIHINLDDSVDSVTQSVTRRYVKSPHNTANLGVQYEYDWDAGLLTAYLDATYTDNSVLSATDSDVNSGERTLVNARLTLSELAIANGDVAVSLWGRNLTDKEYTVHGTNFGSHIAYTWGDPRSYGIDLSYAF